MAWDRLQVRSPLAKVFFRIVQYLAGLMSMLKGGAGVARYDWCVIEKIKQPPAMASERNLFFSALDGCRQMYIIGLFELLASLG